VSEHFSKQESPLLTGELVVKAARAVRAIAFPSAPVVRARMEHGQTNQKLTWAHGYNKNKNAFVHI